MSTWKLYPDPWSLRRLPRRMDDPRNPSLMDCKSRSEWSWVWVCPSWSWWWSWVEVWTCPSSWSWWSWWWSCVWLRRRSVLSRSSFSGSWSIPHDHGGGSNASASIAKAYMMKCIWDRKNGHIMWVINMNICVYNIQNIHNLIHKGLISNTHNMYYSPPSPSSEQSS